MHRNTLLVTAALAVIAALLVGINIGRNLTRQNESAPVPSVTVVPSPVALLRFVSTSCGVSLQYPSNLQPLESTTSGTAFIDSTHPDQSVVLVCQQDIPGVPLTPDKIEAMTIHSETSTATASATLYHDASPKDGTPVDKLIFTNSKKGLDVFVGGYGATFQQIIASLQLIP